MAAVAMHRRHDVGAVTAAAILLFMVSGCGGQVQIEEGRDSGTADVNDADIPDLESGPCNIGPSTVCGLPACTPCRTDCSVFANVGDGDPPFSALGICNFAGAIQKPDREDLAQCNVCPTESALCVKLRESPWLYCAEPTVCDRLVASGFSEGCLNQDKSLWSPSQSVPSVDCPPDGKSASLCGGKCGACDGGALCVGRSPFHAFGVCAPRIIDDGAGMRLNRCSVEGAPCGAGSACFIFRLTESTFQSVANDYGFCLARDVCTRAAGRIPGGGDCYVGSSKL